MFKDKLREAFDAGVNEGAAGMQGSMYVADFDEWYEENKERLEKDSLLGDQSETNVK